MNRPLARALAFASAALLLACRPALAGDPSVPDPVCGDLNYSSSVTSSDALLLLRKAVGQPVDAVCQWSPSVVTFGYTGDIPETATFGENYLLGVKVNIQDAGTLIGFGTVGRSSGSFVRFALYTDSAGEPANLVAATDVAKVWEGRQVVSLSSGVPVAAGTYWIMAVYDIETMNPAFLDAAVNPVRYRQLDFGAPMPATFGDADGYLGSNFNYTVKMTP